MINPDALHTIAAHVGATQVTVSRVDLAGQVHAERTAEHDGSPVSALEITSGLCNELSRCHPARVLGIGAVSGGWVDATSGVIRDHPRLHWQDIAVRDVLEEATGLRVYVDSAAHSHSVADIVFGLTFGVPDFVHVFIGNVIEMATANDGRVHPGLDGFGGDLSNWIFDISGKPLPALEVISDFAVRDRARTEGILRPDGTFEDLVALSPHDERARGLIISRAERAARLVAGIATIFAPSAIVVSSGVVATQEAVHTLEEHFEELLRDRPRPELIVSTNWRTPLATAGAAIVVEKALLNDPLRRTTETLPQLRSVPAAQDGH